MASTDDEGGAALGAAARLDEERRALYTDLVLYALGSAVREALEIEMNITDYEFKSEFFKRKLAEEAAKAAAAGEARGRAFGEANAVMTVLCARGILVSEATRARILECTDLPTLERWIARATRVTTAEEVVADS